MPKEKRNYWMKLSNDFFKDRVIKMIRKECGEVGVIIYQKILLSVMNTDGVFYCQCEGTELAEEISFEIDEEIDDVKKLLEVISRLGVAELTDENITLPDIGRMVGSEAESTVRSRRSRAKKASATNCNADATNCNADATQIREEKIREDTRKDKIREDTREDQDIEQIKFIIDHLNQMAGTSYRYTSGKTKSLIRARFNDGFVTDDFLTVIEKKCNEWIGTEMEKYLRPETLFGTKFEGYLNERVHQKEGRLDWLGRMYNETVGEDSDGLESDVFG